MNACQRIEAELVGGNDFAKFHPFQSFEDYFGSHGAFKWWHQLTAGQFGRGVA